MIKVRKSRARGQADHGWLRSQHSFSFANYYDPEHMGFRSLRVINEDRITGGQGFPPHGHRDMEIISYVVSGALEHRDSAGNVATIRPGEVQRISAGRGVTHSEYNASAAEPAHFFQIWIMPRAKGLDFGYGQRDFSRAIAEQKLTLVVAPTEEAGAISIQQDAKIYVGRLAAGDDVTYAIADGRYVWLQVVSGSLRVGEHDIAAGDGVAVEKEASLAIAAKDAAEFILFDLD